MHIYPHSSSMQSLQKLLEHIVATQLSRFQQRAGEYTGRYTLRLAQLRLRGIQTRVTDVARAVLKHNYESNITDVGTCRSHCQYYLS